MRPITLTVAGLRSYRTQRTLDFTDRSLMAVLGDTGSGKSSLLEALYGALYGGCTWDNRGLGALIADGVKTLQVELVFTARGLTYTVSRSTSRDNYPPAKHILDGPNGEHVDGERAVTRRIEQIIGLNEKEFLRVVILPQGRFGQLLQGTQGERTPILRGILGLGVLDRVREVVDRQATDLADALEPLTAARNRLYPDPGAVGHAAALTAEQHQGVVDRLGTAVVALAALDKATTAVEQSLPTLTAALAESRLVDLTDVLEALLQADEAATAAEARDKKLQDTRALHAATEQDLTAKLTAATSDGFTLSSIARAGSTLESVLVALPELHADTLEQATASADLDAQQAALLEQRIAVEQAAAEATLAKGTLEQLEATAQDAATQVRDAQRRTSDLVGALSALSGRSDGLDALVLAALLAAAAYSKRQSDLQAAGDAATAQFSTLDALRASNTAAHLAGGHHPGDPCPVCSRELPNDFTPAPIVGEDALLKQAADAQAHLDAASTSERKAERILDAARQQLTSDANALAEAATAAGELATTSGWLPPPTDPSAVVSLDAGSPAELTGLIDAAVSTAVHNGAQPTEATEHAVKDLARQLRTVACVAVAPLLPIDLTGSEATARLEPLTTKELVARTAFTDAQATAEALAVRAATHAGELRVSAEQLGKRSTAHQQALERTRAAANRLVERITDLPAMLNVPLGDALGLSAPDPAVALLAAPPLSDTLIATLREALTSRTEQLTAWAEQRELARDAVSGVDRELVTLSKERRANVDLPRTRGRTALEAARGTLRSLGAALPALDLAWVQLQAAAQVPDLPVRGPELVGSGSTVSSACTDVELAAAVAAIARALTTATASVAKTCAASRDGLTAARADTDRVLADAGVPSAAVLDAQLASATHQLVDAQRRQQRATEQQPVAAGLDAGLVALRAQLAVLRAIKDLMSPSAFPNFVVTQRQTALLRIASSLLSKLTRDAYGFGDDFMIVDKRTGQPRHAKTLSGGETFLAALALALALVEISNRSGGQLDCLFLDEGFGSLDSSILGEALDVLREQATGGRLVGVISHLHAVAAELDDVLVVTKNIEGSDFRWLDAAERDAYLLDDVSAGLLS
jgi:exonuclease SbcC